MPINEKSNRYAFECRHVEKENGKKNFQYSGISTNTGMPGDGGQTSGDRGQTSGDGGHTPGDGKTRFDTIHQKLDISIY